MKRFGVVALVLMMVVATGCQSKKGPQTASGLKRVHFDYNHAGLRPDMVTILNANAQYLKKHPKLNIVVEGHCDDRGTNEYNLALGDERATTTKNYLIKQGVSAKRLKTVSFGEEQPIQKGQTEAAWYLNRRAEFVKQ